MRNLKRNIAYSTYYPGSVVDAEGEVPAGGLYAGYFAARRILGEAAADYDKVYYYAEEIEDCKIRFPENKDYGDNIFVVKMKGIAEYGKRYPGGVTSLPHCFVDVWNMADWYATDYIQALEEKIDGLLSI